MDDDVNTPQAIAALFTFVRAANRDLDAGKLTAGEVAQVLQGLDWAMQVLDLLPSQAGVDAELTAWIEGRIEERAEARRSRNFGRADAIRDELLARGVELEDTPGGTRWRVKKKGG